MAKRKTRISKLRVNEVSLVDRPANPVARVLLAKRDDSEDIDKGMTCQSCGAKGVYEKGQCYKCSSVSKALEHNALLDMSVESILADESLTVEKRSEMLTDTVSQFRDSILALVNGSASDAPTAHKVTKQENEPMPEMTKADVEQLLKALSPEQSAVVTEMIAKAVKANETALAEKIEKAQKEAEAAREEIAKRDRLAKAQTMVGKTAVDPNAVADVLAKADAGVEAFVADLLKKYEAAISAGQVLKELGSDRGATTTNAETQLEKAAEDLRKSDSKLTPEQAFAKAAAQNPQLYADYLNGK